MASPDGVFSPSCLIVPFHGPSAATLVCRSRLPGPRIFARPRYLRLKARDKVGGLSDGSARRSARPNGEYRNPSRIFALMITVDTLLVKGIYLVEIMATSSDTTRVSQT